MEDDVVIKIEEVCKDQIMWVGYIKSIRRKQNGSLRREE